MGAIWIAWVGMGGHMPSYGWVWVGISRCWWIWSGYGYKFEGKCWALVWSHMWPSFNQILFQWISIHAGLHTWLNRINQRLWAFGMPQSPGFVLDLSPKDGFENSPSNQETWSISCHVGSPVDFTSILQFTYSVGPSSVVGSRTRTGSAFPTNESAWSGLVTGPQSRVWSGPEALPCMCGQGAGEA